MRYSLWLVLVAVLAACPAPEFHSTSDAELAPGAAAPTEYPAWQAALQALQVAERYGLSLRTP